MGHPGEPGHPDVVAASCAVIRQARAAGIPAGVMGPQAHLSDWLTAGASFFAVASDIRLLTSSAEALLRNLAALPPSKATGDGTARSGGQQPVSA
ncbi:hypothetical protein [Streptomyces sp. NPDC102360]|uniref:hypothetical protein n=1 Tax=Streptomyces sp. NPDC102360 TaxID=3366160 RepID=UPI003807F6FE